ncbi:MAG TPA: hypothetical protein VF476_07075 [Chitinophagaceae bacterium]
MKKTFQLLIVLLSCLSAFAQKPCSADPVYRQFDFWIGEWDVYAKNGNKAGDSKISLILDSCIILEEWTSANVNRGVRYAGKSFNTYNAATKQWQQTWVDNVGGTTEYLKGKFADKKIVFQTGSFPFSKDTMAVRRLTFTDLGGDKVRQFGEISKDNEKTWVIEFDLEYRRRK